MIGLPVLRAKILGRQIPAHLSRWRFQPRSCLQSSFCVVSTRSHTTWDNRISDASTAKKLYEYKSVYMDNAKDLVSNSNVSRVLRNQVLTLWLLDLWGIRSANC